MLQAELVVVEGKQAGATIPLTKKFLVGREDDCHLRPNSELVSRHHCVFTLDDYTVRLRDLGSTNGTFINGVRAAGQVILNDGDEVRIGKLAFKISIRESVQVAHSSRGPAADQVAAPEPVAEPTFEEEAVPVEEGAYAEGSMTMTEMPVMPPPQQQPMPQQQMPMIPGYGMPPGYPPPGYPAPGYPMYQMPPGYGMPGYPMPGYGYQMPAYPGYPQQPMNPNEGYIDYNTPQTDGGEGTAILGGDTTMIPATKKGTTAPRSVELPTQLPDPETTGAKAPPPPPAPVPTAEGAAPAPVASDPRKSAADIIKNYMNRRPGGV